MKTKILIALIALSVSCSKKPKHEVTVTYTCVPTSKTYPYSFGYGQGKEKNYSVVNSPQSKVYVTTNTYLSDGEKYSFYVNGAEGTVCTISITDGTYYASKRDNDNVKLEGRFGK